MAQYWFRPKRYGFGATPITWEGWAATLAVAAVIIGSVVAMNRFVDHSNAAVWLTWAVLIAIATLWFIQFTRRKTDGEWRWRWGERTGE
ncbi:MAG TPA: hypothetical protein VFW22_07665 [Pseudolabrys sp.]|nr:hypothetical protein [Pseudolabrys sp.]